MEWLREGIALAIGLIVGVAPWVIKWLKATGSESRLNQRLTMAEQKQLLADLRQERIDDAARQRAHVAEVEKRHRAELADVRQRRDKLINEMKERHDQDMDELRLRHEEDMAEIRGKHEDCIRLSSRLSERLVNIEAMNDRQQHEIEELRFTVTGTRKTKLEHKSKHTDKETDHELEQYP